MDTELSLKGDTQEEETVTTPRSLHLAGGGRILTQGTEKTWTSLGVSAEASWGTGCLGRNLTGKQR